MEKYHSLEEITDKYIGKRGSTERESFEADVEAIMIGAAIKDARKAQNMTQKELGERVGVQTAQISKIESGRNLTISTIVRVLKGLGLTADFAISGLSPITLGASR
jgi:ribosome-binding protein aMBF1 (putative translation factor)